MLCIIHIRYSLYNDLRLEDQGNLKLKIITKKRAAMPNYIAKLGLVYSFITSKVILNVEEHVCINITKYSCHEEGTSNEYSRLNIQRKSGLNFIKYRRQIANNKYKVKYMEKVRKPEW